MQLGSTVQRIINNIDDCYFEHIPFYTKISTLSTYFLAEMVYEFPDCLHGDELIFSSLILPYHLTTAHSFLNNPVKLLIYIQKTTFGLLKLN